MQNTHANVNSISDLATGNGNDATPFSQQSVVLTEQAYNPDSTEFSGAAVQARTDSHLR